LLDSGLMAMLPLWFVVFLLSVTCHEAAHAYAAHQGGDDTAYRGGQVTLNPIPHVMREPIGTVVVPLITYLNLGYMMGWASAPYDPYWEDRHPKRAAMMAAAGPAANLILALVAFAALKGGLAAGFFETPALLALDRLVAPAQGGAAWLDGVGRLLSIALVLNLVLAVFNFLPLPPMDGASVLCGFWSAARSLRDRLSRGPFGSLLGLLIAWLVFPYVFGPVLRAVVAALHG